MEIILIILTLAILAALFFLIYRLNAAKKSDSDNKLLFEYFEALRKELRETTLASRKETDFKLDKIHERLARGLEHSSAALQKQFAQSSKLITEVTEKLTKLDETNKQVLNFSEKMQSLEDILKNPKQRGILGEYLLETLLSNILPPTQYKLQYQFKNGETVDAAIFFKDKIIPIDAKFSLEKYNKIMEEKSEKGRQELEKEFKIDIKNRIDETSKYILPKENTTDFAFMFIPAEGIYYNLLTYKVGTLDINANDLVEYAFRKHVIIVSPTTFFAYLQTVLQGLKALQMEQSIQAIVKQIETLGRHMGNYESYLQKMGNSLGTTVNMYNTAYKEFHKIDKDIYKISDGKEGGKTEAILIDKPNTEI